MTIINGANNHSVEDILASIRTSIAEESGPARFVSAEFHMPAHTSSRRESHVAEEAPEFELPAIFKPGHHPAPDRPKLLGRLSEALKSTSPAEQGRVRTVIPFDPSAAGRMNEPAQSPTHSPTYPPTYAPAYASTYTPAHMSAASEAANGFASHTDASREQPGEVKRIMPTFFDTRIAKLGEMTREAYAPRPVEPAPIPHAQHQPQQQPQRQPPTLPEGSFAHHASDSVDDAAAQLLRPMLRQWLQENMPKIVEKALLSEVQADLQSKTRR